MFEVVASVQKFKVIEGSMAHGDGEEGEAGEGEFH